MPNDAATPTEVEAIALRVGDGLLVDLWTLYRQEVERMPCAWKDLTADEQEEISDRAAVTFRRVIATMAGRSAVQAIAKGRPTVKGELVSVTVKDKAKAVVEFSTGQPGFDDLIHETGSAVLIVLAGEVEPAAPKVDDKTADMFGPDGELLVTFDGVQPQPGVMIGDGEAGGSATISDGPAP